MPMYGESLVCAGLCRYLSLDFSLKLVSKTVLENVFIIGRSLIDVLNVLFIVLSRV